MTFPKLRYGNVVATFALFIALGGAAYAKNLIDTKDIAKHAVTNKKIAKASIKGSRLVPDALNGKKIKESTLGTVPDAAALGGNGPEDFVPETSVERVMARLAFGGSEVIATHGTLALTATCIENEGGGDVARVLISTNANGATFDTVHDSKEGTGAADFLDTATPAGDRVFAESSLPTGDSLLSRDSDEGVALDAQGDQGVVLSENGFGWAHSLYGADCIIFGTIQTLG